MNKVANKKRKSEETNVPGLKRKEYEQKLRNLHVELVKLQEWVKSEGKKVCVIFEGRDGAGQGGVIKAMTERVSPRVSASLPWPPRRNATRRKCMFSDTCRIAGVERVMGFCTEDQAKGFLNTVPSVEKSMVESGIVLLKYWLEVSPEEQTNRLTARIDEKRKIWKLSEMNLDSYARWHDRATTCLRRPTPRGPPWFIA